MKDDAVIILDPVNRDVIDAAIEGGGARLHRRQLHVSLMLMALGASCAETGRVDQLHDLPGGVGRRRAHMRELLAADGCRHTLPPHRCSATRPEPSSTSTARDAVPARRRAATSQFGAPLAAACNPLDRQGPRNGQSREEWKGSAETNKILGDRRKPIPVRGPLRAHRRHACHSQAMRSVESRPAAPRIERLIAAQRLGFGSCRTPRGLESASCRRRGSAARFDIPIRARAQGSRDADACGDGGSGAASLSWAAVPGAASYTILRNDQGCDTAHTIIATVPAPATNHVDTDLPNGSRCTTRSGAGTNTACESALSNLPGGDAAAFAGTIRLDRAQYGCDVTINVSVLDANIGAPTTAVQVFSATETAPETVVLTGDAGGVASTRGRSARRRLLDDGDGCWRCTRGADHGAVPRRGRRQGGTNLLRQASAPRTASDRSSPASRRPGVTDVAATVTWTTQEASNSLVRYGGRFRPPGTKSDAALVTAHAVSLTGLGACTLY